MQKDKSVGAHRDGALGISLEARGPQGTPFRQNSLTNAIKSKLIHETDVSSTALKISGQRDVRQSPEYLSRVATNTASNIVDSHNIQQNLPDIELIKQIVIPSIISPNDMMNEVLTYTSTDDELGTVTAACLEVVETNCRNFYKVDSDMATELEDILYNVGSYVNVILPEASIDSIINNGSRVSNEELKRVFGTDGNLSPLGILGNPNINGPVANTYSDDHAFKYTVGVESHGNASHGGAYNPSMDPAFFLKVTDNINVLKLPKLKEKTRQDRVADIYKGAGIGAESFTNRLRNNDIKSDNNTLNNSIRDALGSIYTERNFNLREVIEMPTRSQNARESVGRPLVMHLPSESVIPVHTPSDPTEHIGYYVLLDQTGNPIRVTLNDNMFENMRNNYQSNGGEMSSYLANQVNQNMHGSPNGHDTSMMDYEESVRVYTDLVERDLVKRLQNGVYGEELGISRITEIYRIMFSRALAKQHTQLLYIPKTLMSYMALDYNEFGVGRSLIEKTKMISSLRISLLYANAMAVVRNSMTQRELTIELDDMDPSAELTISAAQHRAAIAMNRANPFGGFDPNNIMERLTQASVSTSVSGGAGNFPQTKIGMEYSNSNYTQVDTTFTDDLKEQNHMGLWVTPDMLDTAMGSDFATSIVANSALFAKRTKGAQVKYCELKTMHVRKLCYNDNVILTKLADVIKSNKESIPQSIRETYTDEELVLYFINTIQVSLPEPDISKFEMQMEALENYSTALDKTLPSFISTDILDSEMIGDLSSSITATIATLKAYFMRRYMRENNILPELFDLTTNDENSEPLIKLLEEQNIHIRSIQSSVLEYMRNRMTQTKVTNSQLENIRGDDLEATSGFTSNDTSGESGFDDDFGTSSTDNDNPMSFDMDDPLEEPSADIESETDNSESKLDEEDPSEVEDEDKK